MRLLRSFAGVFIATLFAFGALAPHPAAAALAVTRATLKNGLQVVVVRDPLAPAVTVVLNYKVGSDEQEYPGQAHALEHMMFRGSKTVSESQLSDIGELMGGDQDADTQGEITQYFFSVPSQYLDVALRLEASRAQGLTISQKDWNIERGAIKNEVTQDDSVAIQKLFERTILPTLFAGTPYAHDTLGTLYGFNHLINAPQLHALYNAWYHPNNAVYVITGNVDGPSTIKVVSKYFGAVPAAKLPVRPSVKLEPVKPATYHVDSDQPYSLIGLAFRMPGFKSSDFAAGQILEAVLNNQRGALFGLTASGKALFTGVQEIESRPLAAAAAAFMIVPITTKAETAIGDLNAVLSDYRKNGVPDDLVQVAKARAVANAEFQGNSIQGLAFQWSDAVALKGLSSPGQELNEIKAVTLADVNRVLRTYIVPEKSITAFAVPKNLGKITNHPATQLAKESNKLTLLHHDPLPAWAVAAFKNIQVPAQTLHPTDMQLANGIRLIVQPLHITHTVIVRGSILSNEQIQAPAGKDGVGDVAAALFPFGTTTYSRISLREQLDKIAAEASAGTDFSLDVLSNQFDRGMQLLADEELHPAFPATDFTTVKNQEVGSLTGSMTAPDHLVSVAVNKALFPANDPEQRFATPQTAGSISLDDVKGFYSSVYRPDMTTIVVIGDTTPAAAKALVEKYFGDWKAQGPKPDVYLPAVAVNGPGDVNVPDFGRTQSQVQLVQVNRLTRANPDWATLQVANTILGGGGSSTLFHDLRDVHGYVYSVYTRLDAHKNRGTFEIHYASDPNKILPAQRLALTDLRALQTTPIKADELDRGKAMLVSDIPLRQASFDAVASQLVGFAQLGLPLDQSTIDARRELATTAATLKKTFGKWIRPNDFVRIIQGPAPK
ncbi:MAG: insulinase family protein [Candidatus Eremiobacteraeota bacterium]|nr:insulinase family protein [Candidatus Eremiobacteraeota bacterium]